MTLRPFVKSRSTVSFIFVDHRSCASSWFSSRGPTSSVYRLPKPLPIPTSQRPASIATRGLSCPHVRASRISRDAISAFTRSIGGLMPTTNGQPGTRISSLSATSHAAHYAAIAETLKQTTCVEPVSNGARLSVCSRHSPPMLRVKALDCLAGKYDWLSRVAQEQPQRRDTRRPLGSRNGKRFW